MKFFGSKIAHKILVISWLINSSSSVAAIKQPDFLNKLKMNSNVPSDVLKNADLFRFSKKIGRAHV